MHMHLKKCIYLLHMQIKNRAYAVKICMHIVTTLIIIKRISVNTNIKKKKTFQAFVLILKISSGKVLKYLYKNRK